MYNPRVSILCAMYNSQHFVKTMVESIVAQTYQDWELVIVDDGSTDYSLKIADDLARHDRRIRVFPLHVHRGFSLAFNTAIRLARGAIIARQDADDSSAPDRIEDQLRVLSNDQHKIVSCGTALIRAGGGIKSNSSVQASASALQNKITIPNSATLVCSSVVYGQVGYFSDDFAWAPDVEWTMRAMASTPKIPWSHVSRELYNKLAHSNSLSSRSIDCGEDRRKLEADRALEMHKKNIWRIWS